MRCSGESTSLTESDSQSTNIVGKGGTEQVNSCWACGLTCKPIHPIHTHRRGMHIFRVGHGPFCSSDGSRHNVTHCYLVPPCTRQICKPVKPTTQSPPGHKLLNRPQKSLSQSTDSLNSSETAARGRCEDVIHS